MNPIDALRDGGIASPRELVRGRNIWQGYYGDKHEPVVLKGVRPGMTEQSIRREADIADTIACHPRNLEMELQRANGLWVIPSYGIIETKVGPYFTTPRFLPLSAAIDSSYSSTAVLSFLVHASDAVAAVHRADKYYNDVKPENFVLKSLSDAKPILIDFGTVSNRAPGAHLGVHGTPGFASPQQLAGICDPGADVFGLGASAYHLLTGQHATPRKTACRENSIKEYSLAPAKLTLVSANFADLPTSAYKLVDAMLEPASKNRPRLIEVRSAALASLGEISQ